VLQRMSVQLLCIFRHCRFWSCRVIVTPRTSTFSLSVKVETISDFIFHFLFAFWSRTFLASTLPLQWYTSFYNLCFSLKNKNVDASAVAVVHHKCNRFLWRGEVSVAVAFPSAPRMKKYAGFASLVFGSPVQSRLAVFPFCSVGYVSLLFLLEKIGTVLIYCSKCLGVIYDKEHTTQCSGWVLIS